MPIFTRKRRKGKARSNSLQLLFLSIFLLLSSNASSLPCDDTRCKTQSCDENGTCICDLPDLSTILDGDRKFLGGRFCDEERIMCDGTNSFWCGHGGICEEIVHGENYTCKCSPGYTGEHCEHTGAPCGKIFCFHQAECLFEAEGDVCDCPPNWKGSIDCSLPTRTNSDSITNSTIPKLPRAEDSPSSKWLVLFFVVSFASGAAAVAVIYLKRFVKKKERATAKFQQLSQMQARDFLDDDDDEEAFVPRAVHNDDAHL
ncbi:Epidermal growth factor-like domain [Macleaya cordata]|uniref:Epidermal growth factor-like domain n=1 Tax=Macleaya cordata TaxID=56857 RepID=A0A200QU39_MACCD|nr:Epidermal growth factor-like domain [Macleaya cordata]